VGTGAPDELDPASALDDADAAGALALGAWVMMPLAASLARTCAASVAA
jgi:hypothetical protein